MTDGDNRLIRKILNVLRRLRDKYARDGNTAMSSRFARAMAILLEALDEDRKGRYGTDES